MISSSRCSNRTVYESNELSRILLTCFFSVQQLLLLPRINMFCCLINKSVVIFSSKKDMTKSFVVLFVFCLVSVTVLSFPSKPKIKRNPLSYLKGEKVLCYIKIKCFITGYDWLPGSASPLWLFQAASTLSFTFNIFIVVIYF